jgi:ribosomal protein L30/L7E
MATSVNRELIQVIKEGQAQMIDYLKRADERGERQSRVTLKALSVLQDGQKVLHEGQKAIAQMLVEVQAITVRTLELTRDIHSTVLDKKSSQH